MHCYDENVRTRLLTISGHVNGIIKMADEGEGCEKILLQLSAVESAIDKLGKYILKDHLNHCVKESIQRGEDDILDNFNTILEKFL